ncbi:MAG TPA: choice-of-anchor Q domain-containing protein [Solirubrobacterales bacterium]|nr:choice-of-anchor Q domain-containing protein [Solirubrobacterales bacterium]
MVRGRVVGVLAAAMALLALAGEARAQTPGTIMQLAGQDGCIAGAAYDGCAVGSAIEEDVTSVAISPDGANVYAVSQDFGAEVDPDDPGDNVFRLAVFDRGTDGTLTQKPNGHALDGAGQVVVSPDGENVYVTTPTGVAVFDRAANGTLTDNGGANLERPGGLALSPDGDQLYVTSQDLGDPTNPNDDAGEVAVFSRAANGSLTQISSPALDGVSTVAVSPDGASVYAGYDYSDDSERVAGVAVFDRQANGILDQKPGADGCVAETNLDGCADGVGLQLSATSLAVSPDGTSVYSAAGGDSEFDAHLGQVAVFDRAADGTLTQKGGGQGCLSGRSQGVPPAEGCTDAPELQAANSLAVSPDGASLYATALRWNTVIGGGGIVDGTVVALDRASDGSLARKSADECCIYQTALDGGAGAGEGRGVIGAVSVAVSPDNLNVYSGALGSDGNFGSGELLGAVGVFNRVPAVTPDDPPETTITSGPTDGSTITEDRATFEFSSDEPGSSFECRLDEGAFTACASPFETPALADGEHTFSVRAIDPDDNADPTPASRTFTVDSDPGPDPGDMIVNDEGDDGGPGTQANCLAGAAGCTLRAAIAVSNGDDLVNSITFTEDVTQIDLSNGILSIADDLAGEDVAITGNGARELEVSGTTNPGDAELAVEAGAEARISALAVADGGSATTVESPGEGTTEDVSISGAGISNAGTLALDEVAIKDSGTSLTVSAGEEAIATASGGGIVNTGTLTLTGSTVSGNSISATATAGDEDGAPGAASATARGGGILNTGTLVVQNSTVSGNSNGVNATGGSTNTTDSQGGGITVSGGIVNLDSSTVAFNSADAAANLAALAPGTVAIRSTLVAEPQGAGESCQIDAGSSAGFNLDDGTSCGFDQPTDQTDSDPMLISLADNGGETDTHAIPKVSPATDQGDSEGLDSDQRGDGFDRTVDIGDVANNDAGTPGDPSDDGVGTDVGAFELESGGCPEGTSETVVCTPLDGGGLRMEGTGADEALIGTDSDDVMKGGGGDDELVGGKGKDEFKGGGGNDVINAKGQRKEKVNCGSGNKDKAKNAKGDKVSKNCEKK